MLEKRAIEEATENGFTSRLFTTPKKTGDLRPVLNLKPLNVFLPERHFKMEAIRQVSTLINKGDYLTSVDLQDAFLHVLIHPSHRKYLQFHWKGHQFQFRVLPFGLSLAPYVFTKILKPVLKWARRKGIRISAYLDDLIIVAANKELSRLHTSMILKRLETLGFLVKKSKSQLEPTQSLQHLGFTIDTRQMTLSVPKDKVRDVRREAQRILNRGNLTVRCLASFIGKTLAMTAAVLPARLRTQNLVHLKNNALRQHKQWTASISLTTAARKDLQWWAKNLSSWNGQTWIQQPPQEELFTDASDSGWGIVHQSRLLSGTWNRQLLNKHINYKELFVIWKVVTSPQFQGRRLRIYVDNTTTMAYVNKFGGTKSLKLMVLANKIWTHCLTTGTTISTAFVPSSFNPADPPSRQLEQQLEWSLTQDCFNMIDNKWGPHQMDLFASNKNNKLPRYMSWRHDPSAYAQDALHQPWTNLGRLYVCPPWNLLPQVLERLRREKLPATVITPNWTGSLWYPMLQKMTTQPPIDLPRTAVQSLSANEPGLLSKNLAWHLQAWNVNAEQL